jgi:hypothetical protein
MRISTVRQNSKWTAVFCAAVAGLLFLSTAAQACPMCSQSIAEENLLPHAYMYSIIFMLSMPAMVFTGIGSFIFFQFRKASSTVPADASFGDFDASDDSGVGEPGVQV